MPKRSAAGRDAADEHCRTNPRDRPIVAKAAAYIARRSPSTPRRREPASRRPASGYLRGDERIDRAQFQARRRSCKFAAGPGDRRRCSQKNRPAMLKTPIINTNVVAKLTSCTVGNAARTGPASCREPRRARQCRPSRSGRAQSEQVELTRLRRLVNCDVMRTQHLAADFLRRRRLPARRRPAWQPAR